MGSDCGSSTNGEAFQSDEEVTVNPCPPDWLGDEENAILRVDAIGDTAYTHRWVLKCLNTVAKSLSKYLVPPPADLANGNPPRGNNDNSPEVEDDNCDAVDIVELDSDIEDAVCQLWDMTTSVDVIMHLLNLEEIDIMDVAKIIIGTSRSPRLTEVMIGIVANISCPEFGMRKILDEGNSHNNIVSIIVNQLSSTSDVPSLCEVFRFLCALAHYRACSRNEPSSDFLPSWRELCGENVRKAIVFILANSLSDILLNRVLDFLSSFLNFNEDSLNISEVYSERELIHGLITVIGIKYAKFEEHLSEEELEPMRHCAACLYSFLGGQGSHFITEDQEKAKSLENVLVQLVEYEGKVESVSDLSVSQTQSISTSITILKFFIPFISKPSVISSIGRLLSIIYGQTHQYTVTRSTSKEELNLSVSENTAFKEFSEFFELKWAEEMESDKNAASSSIRKEFSLFTSEKMEEVDAKVTDFSATRNDSPACSITGAAVGRNHGWLSPSPAKDPTGRKGEMKLKLKSSARSSTDQTDDHGEQSEELDDLKDVLEEYCSDLLRWWWNSAKDDKSDATRATQGAILQTLDQCHVHEVIFIFGCVRRKSPLLVAELQERLLDSGKHVRLVGILSHMYQ